MFSFEKLYWQDFWQQRTNEWMNGEGFNLLLFPLQLNIEQKIFRSFFIWMLEDIEFENIQKFMTKEKRKNLHKYQDGSRRKYEQ